MSHLASTYGDFTGYTLNGPVIFTRQIDGIVLL